MITSCIVDYQRNLTIFILLLSLSFLCSADQDADLIWAQHYSDGCTKEACVPVSQKPKERCAVALCNQVLGITNSYTCPKCGIKVCLAHRIPEDHGCVAMDSLSNSSSAYRPAGFGGATKEALDYSSKMAREKKKNQQTKIDHSNTLKGTAELRRQRSQAEWSCSACTSLNKASETSCTVCGTSRMAGREGSSTNYVDSGPRDHRAGVNGSVAAWNNRNSNTSSSYSTNGRDRSNYNNDNGRDVSICPFCSMRFNDPVDLIQHCETAHPDRGSDDSRSNTTRPTPKRKGKKCICS